MSRSVDVSPGNNPHPPAGEPPRGVRAAGKARSRQKLLESAKRLFMERGYHGATVRDIAGAAGLSTGAVFASFSDKADLFNAVLMVDNAEQVGLLEEAAAKSRGSAVERLTEILAKGYAFQSDQLELLRAAIGVSWSQGLSGALGDRPVREAATATIAQVLQDAIAAGELRPDVDLELLVDTIWDCYVANYRYALYSGWSEDQLSARFRAQVQLILASQRAA